MRHGILWRLGEGKWFGPTGLDRNKGTRSLEEREEERERREIEREDRKNCDASAFLCYADGVLFVVFVDAVAKMIFFDLKTVSGDLITSSAPLFTCSTSCMDNSLSYNCNSFHMHIDWMSSHNHAWWSACP